MSKLTDAEYEYVERSLENHHGPNRALWLKALTELRESRRLLRAKDVVAWGVEWVHEDGSKQRAVFSDDDDRDEYIVCGLGKRYRATARRFRVVRGAK